MSVELQHINFEVKDKKILDDVSFRIDDGEFVSLLGASGAGKSTTIKIAAGITEQTSGHVLVDDKVVDDVPTSKRRVTIAFQDSRLFPNMSVGENVAFPLRMRGMRKAERVDKADYYLSLVQLKGFGKRRPDELSGGQQQRVALARAVAAEPNVLLLDEPFSGLDENLRDDMRSVVKNLHNTLGMTSAMITHDASEALTMSDHIIYMTGGRVVQYATPPELYANPATKDVALCFGNALDISGDVAGGVFRNGPITFPVEAADGPAVAVLRHEGIELVPDESSSIAVYSCLFGGEQYLVVLRGGEFEQTLVTKEFVEPGTHVRVEPAPGTFFVYPDEQRSVR